MPQLTANHPRASERSASSGDLAVTIGSCRRFAANQALLLMGVLAYNLLHTLRQFYLVGEEGKRSMEWLIKVGAKVAYHGRRWQVHEASAFPLAHHYRAVFRRRQTLSHR